MMRLIAFVVCALTLFGCANSPSAPTPLACQTSRTGTVTFRNAGTRTVDILWNNSRIVTVSPGQISSEFTVAAGGAQYVMDILITNTNIRPCQILVATPLQCQNNPYATCGGF